MPEHDRTSTVGSRLAWTWAAFGLALAPGAPLGLFAWYWLAGVPADSEAARGALLYSGLMTAIVFAGFGYGAGRLMDQLRAAALHDGLTGLFNHRFLRESLPQMQAATIRRGAPLCIIMIDLDLFKQVNDNFGHIVGDQTLRAVSEALRSSSRRTDIVARYGGEEFAILCPDTDADLGLHVAERLRTAVEALGPERLGHPGPQTISLGVAVQSGAGEFSPEQLLDEADRAMYEAKRRGRNQTVARIDGRDVGG